MEVELPPLRERSEDVPTLAQRFLEEVTERLGLEKRTLSEVALARLVRFAWPGNVRQLRNVIEQAAVLASGESIEEDDLHLDGPVAAQPAAADDLAELPFASAKRQAVERFEREFLLRALRSTGGNISRAAESIGMVRQSLQQKIRELGLRSEDWTQEE